MPTKARSPKNTGRPAGGKQSKPKLKLWVLWEPPAQVLLFVVVAALFAGAGFTAMRFSDAQSNDDATAGSKTVLWQDTPDSNIGQVPAQHWLTTAASQYVYGGATVGVVADETKGKVIEFFGQANGSHVDAYGYNQRAEQIADLGIKKGNTYWFGFDLLIPSGSGVTNGRQAIWQILPQPDKSPAKLWLAVNSNQDGLAIESDKASIRIGSIPTSQWSRVVIGVRVEDDSSAWVEAWRDGQLTSNKRPIEGGVVSSNVGSAAMSVGLYRSPQPWDLSVKMANLRIGTTRDAVQ